MTDLGTLNLLLPETVLIAAATLIYLMGAFAPKHFRPNLAAGGAILVAAAVAIYQDGRTLPLFHTLPNAWISGPIAADIFGHTARWAILLFGLLFVMLSSYSENVRPAAEYVGSVLFMIAGLMLIASAYDLVMMFLGLELVSIPTYVILYLGRRDASGQEATAKYFFLSILSSALLLYGFSFLYGLAGSTRLDMLASALTANAGTTMVVKLAPIALLLVFAGLGFRMTAVLLHFYTLPTYQGTNNSERRHAFDLAEDCRLAGLGADRGGLDAGTGIAGVARGARDVGADDDARQRAGPVARQHPPAAGVFLDRARRIHADRSRGRFGECCDRQKRGRGERRADQRHRHGVVLSDDVLSRDDRRVRGAQISRLARTAGRRDR